jgi:dTDP-glucose pyrophosphorylase
MVVGYLGDQIERALGDGASLGSRVDYARQGVADGTARAVALARDFVGEDRFVVGWADILVDPVNYVSLIEASGEADGALAVNEVDDPSAGAAVYVDADMRVERIVEKPVPGTSGTRWNNAGLCVLPPEIWPFIDAAQPSVRGEYELPQAVAAFVAGGGNVRAVPIEGPWFDIGTPADLEAARAALG